MSRSSSTASAGSQRSSSGGSGSVGSQRESSSGSVGGSASEWYQPQEGCCDCEDSLYTRTPRVHTQGLDDYGDEQDQFIVRRDCSRKSRRYTKCDIWVSTCRPSSMPDGRSSRDEAKWKETCPQRQRRFLQDIKGQEAEREAERKARLAAKQDQPKKKKKK